MYSGPGQPPGSKSPTLKKARMRAGVRTQRAEFGPRRAGLSLPQGATVPQDSPRRPTRKEGTLGTLGTPQAEPERIADAEGALWPVTGRTCGECGWPISGTAAFTPDARPNGNANAPPN